MVQLQRWVLVVVAALSPCVGCIPTPDGCNALDRGDECHDNTSRCVSGKRQHCLQSPCGNFWYDDSPPQGMSYCVATDSTHAEYAATPSCASTSVCSESGLCGDGSNGCVATEAGCANAQTCPDDGRCGFDGTYCVGSAVGCQASASCRDRGYCGLSMQSCVPTAGRVPGFGGLQGLWLLCCPS